MDFTESFGFGSSTLDNLESQVKHAINGAEQNAKDVDIIFESPKEENAKNSSKRIMEKSRRNLRKSKSDSKLLDKASKDLPNNERFTQFFESDFGFSLEEQIAKQGKENLQSLIDVSQLEAVFETNESDNERNSDYEEDDGLVSKWEVPICSEDLHSFEWVGDDGTFCTLQTETEVEQDSLVPLQFSNSLNLNASNKELVDVEPADLTEDEINDMEELPALDESSFICPAKNVVSKRNLQASLEESKLELEQFQTSNSLTKANVKNKTTLENKANQSIKKQSTAVSKDLESLKLISAWGLPQSVLAEYERKSILKMFDWQIECLSNPKVLFEHCNLVYSAPTSAGKTLVSEILMLKSVLERNKKVLMILPFISVVREKMFYLQDLLTPSGYRVEGFFGGYTPPGGFESIHIAICTIEKANSIVNKLLEQNKLDCIGTVVVDEIHLISDPGRGYILELLLAKILYMSRKYGLQIQLITMSATLANVELLKRWLDAELYITNFRPVALHEMIKIGTKIYDDTKLLRDLAVTEDSNVPILDNDADNVAQLCLETLLEGCSVIIFCPSKDWCEKLAIQLAGIIHGIGKSGSDLGLRVRQQLKREAIDELKRQLRDIPTGLDAVLEKTITFGCAFHHAGLTTEERDIVEASFKNGALKIIVATSTLSSGVNLPARRVLIRSPLFGGKPMNSLTYKQMIGRAGRTGKDTLGESILICTPAQQSIGRDLITAELKPISSCLELDNSTHLKRALLEVISSGVANTKQDLGLFINCTLLSAQKLCNLEEKDSSSVGEETDFIGEALAFLMEYEFVRLQNQQEDGEANFIATRLGLACLASSMPPTDGLILFTELQKSRRCFVLESELHAVYLVTPYSVCYQMQEMDWLFFLDLWEKLSPAMKKVGELVGVKESFLVRAMRAQSKLDYKSVQVHKRFYTALALQELVNETPINVVAQKFKCTRGQLQSLQQLASTFAGIVTAFCNALQWDTLALIVSQFKERLFFGIQRDLIDLMRLPDLTHKRARVLFDAGITNLIELANAEASSIEKILHNSLSFDSAKPAENENERDAEQRMLVRNFFITGKVGMTVAEAAKLLISEARQFIEYEVGTAGGIQWSQEQQQQKQDEQHTNLANLEDMHMSCDENDPCQNKRKSQESDKKEETPKKMAKLKKSEATEVAIGKEIENSETKPKHDTKENHAEQKSLKNKHKTENDPKATRNKTMIKNEEKLSQRQQKHHKEHHRENAEKSKISKPHKEKQQPDMAAKKKSERYVIPKIKRNEDLAPSFNSVKESTILTPNAMNAPAIRENTKINLFKDHQKSNNLLESSNRKESHHISHNQQSNTFTKTKKAQIEDIFADEESFVVNSQLAAALAATATACTKEALPQDSHENIPSLPPRTSAHDEIPSSQNICDEEFNSSTAASASSTTCNSRLLRSLRTQRLQSPLAAIEQVTPLVADNENSNLPPKVEKTSTSASNISLDELLLDANDSPYIMQMNASHILSCSKDQITDNASSSFDSVEIIDICGNFELFELAYKEIVDAKRCGFCLGVQVCADKMKPLIGANLLINQQQQAAVAAAVTNDETLFSIDEQFFINGLAFCVKENVVFYMNLQTAGSCAQISTDFKKKRLLNLLRMPDFTLIIYEARKQLKLLRKAMPELEEINAQLEDPKVANWLLQPDQRLSLKQLAQQYAPECAALVNLSGGGRGDKSHGIDASSAISSKLRCSIEACVIVHILQGQCENLERIGSGELRKFFNELEMPIQLSLCNMEIVGFPTSEVALRDLYQKMLDTTKKLEAKIYALHGKRFNLGSAQAVAKVLGLCRKPNGRVSTSRQVLEKIDDPLADLIISYRKLYTTMTKNIQPLLQCVQNNRIHGQSDSFTATGRISMKEPNLQNVAKDFEIDLGYERISICCRRAFFPEQSQRCLISADFCQLEMRVLAHMSKDQELLKTMSSPNDVFTAIAAGWNDIKESEVSEQLRNGTKQICYGIIYGMGMRALSEALKCTELEAQQVSEQYHLAYPAIRSFTRKIVEFARRHGYVETIQGRKRYLEHINSAQINLKNQAERQAVNSAIQGSAADIAKRAILQTQKNILKYCPKLGLQPHDVQFVLHLHDELIFEVPIMKAKKIAKIISVTMERCTKLAVPLKVKLRMGRNWGEMQEINF